MERIIFEQSPLVFNQSNAWNLKFVYLLHNLLDNKNTISRVDCLYWISINII